MLRPKVFIEFLFFLEAQSSIYALYFTPPLRLKKFTGLAPELSTKLQPKAWQISDSRRNQGLNLYYLSLWLALFQPKTLLVEKTVIVELDESWPCNKAGKNIMPNTSTILNNCLPFSVAIFGEITPFWGNFALSIWQHWSLLSGWTNAGIHSRWTA